MDNNQPRCPYCQRPLRYEECWIDDEEGEWLWIGYTCHHCCLVFDVRDDEPIPVERGFYGTN
jgi:hypothetical protein